MKKLIFSCMIVLLVCSAFLRSATATTFIKGYPVIGGTSNAGFSTVFMQIDLDVPSGFLAQINTISAYLANDTAGIHAQLGIYSSNDRLVAASETFIVNGASWYPKTLQNAYLQNGSAWLAICFEAGGAYRYYDAAAGHIADFQVEIYPLPDVISRSDWGSNALSIYIEFEYVELGATSWTDKIQEVMFGELWFLPFLLIGLLCIVIVKVEKYAVAIVIPALLVLEALYYTNNSASGSMIWAMVSSLILIFFVAAIAVLDK